jgi:hypothetical protein
MEGCVEPQHSRLKRERLMIGLRVLMHSIAELLRAWWRVDRIRAAPSDGRLLRLQPPCFVTIDGGPFEIARRVVGQDAGGPFVVYECHATGGSAQLIVRLVAESQQTSIRWIGPDGERRLNERDVAVFSK